MDLNQAKSILEANGIMVSTNDIPALIAPFNVEEFNIDDAEDTKTIVDLVRKSKSSMSIAPATQSKAISKPARRSKKDSPIVPPQKSPYVGNISDSVKEAIAIQPHEVIRGGANQYIQDHINEAANAATQIATVIANTGVIMGAMVNKNLEEMGMVTFDEVVDLRQEQWEKAKEENENYLGNIFEKHGLPRDLLTRGKANG